MKRKRKSDLSPSQLGVQKNSQAPSEEDKLKDVVTMETTGSVKKRRKMENSISKGKPVSVKNQFHFFTDSKDVAQFRQNLLRWYDANKRDLPWREWANHPNCNQRAYAVWVSEIMLQQTQVATVIDYYNRWMLKWPTLEDLAYLATTEEVNEMWAGLGYYSRGRRLHEGAKKVMDELFGVMPRDAESLMKCLPGVGRYTAGAIASIAFKQQTGVVDGNVIRVLCRARAIGADSTSPLVQSTIWSLANELVDPDRPGDFNQAVMELGATVCTPKAPSCDKCPIKNLCRAFQHEEHLKSANEERLKKEFAVDVKMHTVPDIECAADNCRLCLPADKTFDIEQGVTNFPRKPKRKPPRPEQTAVCIIQKKTKGEPKPQFLVVQRPEKGLLAGLWEFPSVGIEHDWSAVQRSQAVDAYLKDELKISFSKMTERCTVGEVVHIFSHIEQTYYVETFTVQNTTISEQPMKSSRPYKWLLEYDFWTGAVSTAMKKCFSAYKKSVEPLKINPKKLKFDSGNKGDGKKQSALDSFFKTVINKKS